MAGLVSILLSIDAIAAVDCIRVRGGIAMRHQEDGVQLEAAYKQLVGLDGQ
jgi:hypothetical protein